MVVPTVASSGQVLPAHQVVLVLVALVAVPVLVAVVQVVRRLRPVRARVWPPTVAMTQGVTRLKPQAWRFGPAKDLRQNKPLAWLRRKCKKAAATLARVVTAARPMVFTNGMRTGALQSWPAPELMCPPRLLKTSVARLIGKSRKAMNGELVCGNVCNVKQRLVVLAALLPVTSVLALQRTCKSANACSVPRKPSAYWHATVALVALARAQVTQAQSRR